MIMLEDIERLNAAYAKRKKSKEKASGEPKKEAHRPKNRRYLVVGDEANTEKPLEEEKIEKPEGKDE